MDLNTCTCMRTQKAETLSKETTMNIAGVTVKEQSEMIHNNGYNTPLIWTTLICINHYTSTSTVVVQFFFASNIFESQRQPAKSRLRKLLENNEVHLRTNLSGTKSLLVLSLPSGHAFPHMSTSWSIGRDLSSTQLTPSVDACSNTFQVLFKY